MPRSTRTRNSAHRMRLLGTTACLAALTACSTTAGHHTNAGTHPTRTKNITAGTTGSAIAHALHCRDITTPAENPPGSADPASSADCQLPAVGELEIYSWLSRADQAGFETAIRQSEDIGGDVDTFVVSGPRWDVTIDEQLEPGTAQRDATAMQHTIGGRVEHVISN